MTISQPPLGMPLTSVRGGGHVRKNFLLTEQNNEGMLPRKVEEGGKKYLLAAGEKIELATPDFIREQIRNYIIPEEKLKLDKSEVFVNERVSISGSFAVSEAGNYNVKLVGIDEASNKKFEVSVGTLKVKQKKEKYGWNEIQDAVNAAFYPRYATHKFWHFADTYYKPADLTVIKEVLASTEIEKMRYEAESFDCDDFSFALQGAFHMRRDTAAMAIFIFWTLIKTGETSEGKDIFVGHACNLCYDGSQVLLIEPQTDAIFKPPENWYFWILMG